MFNWGDVPVEGGAKNEGADSQAKRQGSRTTLQGQEAAAVAQVGNIGPRRVLDEARAILTEHNSNDDDMLPPVGRFEWVNVEEDTKRFQAQGTGRLLSAWGVPPLQPTEADRRKQRMYERVHRTQFRKRNAANFFGNPDEIDELVLDIDKVPERVENVVIKLNRESKTATQAVAGPSRDTPAHKLGDLGDNISDARHHLIASTGNYLNMVLGQDRVTAAATAAEKQSAEAIAAQIKLDTIPAHLRRFINPQLLELPEGSQVVKISGGREHAMVLLKTSDHLERILPRHQENQGRVLMMGSGEHGQLGLGDQKPQTIPVVLATLGEHIGWGGGGLRVRMGGDRIGGHSSKVRRAVDIAAGAKHSVAVSEDGEVAAFGTDTNGCTGQGENGLNKTHRLPRWMYWISTDTTRILACATGESHTLLLSASWHVFTTGDGAYGKLGHGDTRSFSTPRRVEPLIGLKISSISAGHNHSLFITDSGLLYGCGANSHGQLGSGDFDDRMLPVRIYHPDFIGDPVHRYEEGPELRTLELQERILGPLPGVKGQFLSNLEAARPFAQPTEQQLEAAVKAREAKLGIQQQQTDEDFRLKLGIAASKPNTSRVTQACGGRAHTVILTQLGQVYVCGQSNRGQLGLGNRNSVWQPTLVQTMVNLSCVQIAAGDDHSVMLSSLGHAYVCGRNDTAQLGDGTLDDSLVPKPMQPVITKELMRDKSKYEILSLQNHPMFGVLIEQVFAAGSSTFAVVSGGENVYVCGSGAYGHPQDRNPTGFAEILRLTLDDKEQKKALVMASTVRMLRPDEQGFNDLVRQMVLYSRYNEKCLAHIMKVMMEEVLQKPTFVVLYGSILEECRKTCLGCTALAFRRVILLAIEDAGVKLLHAQSETLNKRMLHKMGWAKYQQEQREGAGFTGGSGQLTYYDMITDRDSYMDFKRFRDDCKAMQGLVRELFEVHGILLEDDMRDIAAGFPGSQHSVGIIDSEEAKKKSTFFANLSRWKSPGERAAEEATRAQHLTETLQGGNVTKRGSESADLVRQKGLSSCLPVPSRAIDEAAWEFSESVGWEQYKLSEDIRPDEGAGWGNYIEEQRKHAKYVSPVIIPGEDIEEAELAEAEKDLDDHERRQLQRLRALDRRKRLVGLDGKRIVESTLAPSFHRSNTVMTTARSEIETIMTRKLGSTSSTRLADHDSGGGERRLATRKLKLQNKLASMASSGESVQTIEEYKHNAETNPAFGYFTQDEIDAAPPEVQEERARRTFQFAQKIPEDKTFDIFEET